MESHAEQQSVHITSVVLCNMLEAQSDLAFLLMTVCGSPSFPRLLVVCQLTICCPCQRNKGLAPLLGLALMACAGKSDLVVLFTIGTRTAQVCSILFYLIHCIPNAICTRCAQVLA